MVPAARRAPHGEPLPKVFVTSHLNMSFFSDGLSTENLISQEATGKSLQSFNAIFRILSSEPFNVPSLRTLVISRAKAQFTNSPVLIYYYMVSILIPLGSCPTGTYSPISLLTPILSTELECSNPQYRNTTARLKILSQISSTGLS